MGEEPTPAVGATILRTLAHNRKKIWLSMKAGGGSLKVSLDLPRPDLRSRNSSVSICRGIYTNAGQGASYDSAKPMRKGGFVGSILDYERSSY